MRQNNLVQSFASDLPLHLVEELNHRVANEYAEAISGLSVAAAQVPAVDAQIALFRAVDRLRAHAGTHRALLPPMDGEVNLADYIGRLCAAMSKASLAERSAYLTLDAPDIWLSSSRAWRIGLAVAELVRNAARHGLGGGGGGITVELIRSGEQVFCKVSDNGRCSSSSRPGRGMGLVSALAAELHGEVDWQFGEGGCMAQLHVPLEDP
jgi:two-component sensor histidine kinase